MMQPALDDLFNLLERLMDKAQKTGRLTMCNHTAWNTLMATIRILNSSPPPGFWPTTD